MRRLTVIERYYGNDFGNGSHGEIRIKGKWLSAYGFDPGNKVKVLCTQGQLIILKDPEAQPQGERVKAND